MWARRRLAIEVGWRAADHFDKVVFVSLVAVSNSRSVIPAVLDRLSIVVEKGEHPTVAIATYMRGTNAILILDNFEHVVAAAPEVGNLRTRCPSLVVVCTSRRGLNVYGERV